MPEMTIEEWVEQITKAHNNHAKAIEVLELRERSLKEITEAQGQLINDLRLSLNKVLEHLEITLED
jgi:hypothetical protein|tara:strand:- start:47 stop:244 length:198 start_codon:yes stop_codon:yes gene_type:complete